MAGDGITGDGDEVAEHETLWHMLGDLVAQLAVGRDREQRDRVASLVKRLGTPSARFLQPEMERRLMRYVDAGDSFARDQIAHVLAIACGAAALPALLRAMVDDRNDDGNTLQLDALELFLAWPGEAHTQMLACVASNEPGLRRVGIWGLSVTWSRRDEYLPLVVRAGSDPDSRVRIEAMGALGSVFGAGDPRALTVVTAGTHDHDAEVRRAAVSALQSWRDDAVTELLVSCADDEDRWVRFWAAWALSHRPGVAARTALDRLAADEDADVRAAALKVLDLEAPPI